MFKTTQTLFRTYLKQHQPLTKRKKESRRVSKKINSLRVEFGLPPLKKQGMRKYNRDPWKQHQTDLNSNISHLDKWIQGRQKKIREYREELRVLEAQAQV